MRSALDGFLAQVRTIEKFIEVRAQLIAFGQAPRRSDSTIAVLRRSVRDIGVAGMQPSLDGSVLLIAAAFEQFVSDLMIAYADGMPAIIPAYGDLPNALRSANERFTGEAISRTRNSRFTEFELQRFISNLNDCHTGRPYILNGAAIALNDRNLNSGTLRELISRLGVENIWAVVGSTRGLQRWSGPGGAKIAVSRAQTQLNELVNNRNHIAHRVGSTALGPQVVASYIRFGRALTRSLVRALENHAASL